MTMAERSPGKYVMPLGKYSGRTLDEIAVTDEGLRYLDWMVGQEWVRDPLRAALKTYLLLPAIARDLDRITED
jgi:uncharacterized protein (DUF3820 family)